MEYIGQYANKYYLIGINIVNRKAFAIVWDSTKDKRKMLVVNQKTGNIKINGETLNFYMHFVDDQGVN